MVRYTAEGVHEQFGEQFQVLGSENEMHQAPWGSEQGSVYCYCKLAS